MKRPGQVLALVLALGLFLLALILLFHWRIERGDLFPDYSSLRADERGTRAFRDALQILPGMSAESRTAPLAALPATPDRTLFLAGIERSQWPDLPVDAIDALDAAVRAGSRLIIGFAPDRPAAAPPSKPKGKEEPAGPKKPAAAKPPLVAPGPAVIRLRWGLALADAAAPAAAHVRRAEGAPSGLPPTLAWTGTAAFTTEADAGWRALYSGRGGPAVLERPLGAGTIVVLGDSFPLTNEALQRDRQSPFLAWLVGPNHRVVFDETHLGVALESGPATLARRYRLGAAVATFILVALLYAWQRSAVFVPPEEEVRDIILRYHPAEALQALLKRSVAPEALPGAFLAEWKQTARKQDWRRVEEAVHGAPDAISAYNAATRALRRRPPHPLSL
jgi:hypothetical protein